MAVLAYLLMMQAFAKRGSAATSMSGIEISLPYAGLIVIQLCRHHIHPQTFCIHDMNES